MFEFLKNLLRGSNEAEIKRLKPLVDKIDALEPKFQAMTDAEMNGLTAAFRERLSKGETLDDLLIVASFLAMAGYRDEAILGALRERLFSTYNFCRQGKYGIYADKTGYRRVPEIWTDVPLVDPALYPGDDWYLPWIHDVNGFAVLLTASPDGMPVSEMVDTVVRYVLNPEYQALRDGYGIVTDGKGRYWAMGWSVHLPGLPGCPRVTSQAGLVGRLATMSAFEAAREHAWFRDGLAYLESFRTPRGTYVFPREILPEKKTSYWVGGTHCGLGENRRTRNWLELESTYWALRCRRSYANR
jgi:hypothetical protein